jgi:hypothetical protein
LREIGITTTIRYLASVTIAFIKKKKMLVWGSREREIYYIVRRNMEILWRTLWRCPKELKTHLLCNPAVPRLGTLSKEMKPACSGHICTPLFDAITNN